MSHRPPIPPPFAQMAQVPARPPTAENIQRFIVGELGAAPMRGVQTFPYTVPQRVYHKDFSAIVASQIQHPYMATAKPCGSTPHNILSGSGYSDKSACVSEHDSAYSYKSFVAARQAKPSGVRVEQIS